MPGELIQETWEHEARVYEGIDAIERAGVLRPLSLGKRNRTWEASGILEVVDQLETGSLASSSTN